MNKLFKLIRSNDFDAVQKLIEKDTTIVNEVYTASRPKKDIGQSPLQVAIKCGEFEMIDLFVANGADVNFIEDPKHSNNGRTPLADAICFTFDALCYKQYDTSQKYVEVTQLLLEKGADPNQLIASGLLPLGMAVVSVEKIVCSPSLYLEIQEIARIRFAAIWNLLIKHGADIQMWLEQEFWGVSNKIHYLDEKMYSSNNEDIRKPMRELLSKYLEEEFTIFSQVITNW